jgi:hypothetical protein
VQDAGDDLSSFRSGPGWSLGMNGSIAAHCSSESQNRSAIAPSELQTVARRHKMVDREAVSSSSQPGGCYEPVVP